VHEYIPVDAGCKEEVASRLAAEHQSWWTCVKVPHPHDEMGKPSAVTLSNHLLHYLFLLGDCQIYSELGEPVYLEQLQL
jgi:hypothetical protein